MFLRNALQLLTSLADEAVLRITYAVYQLYCVLLFKVFCCYLYIFPISQMPLIMTCAVNNLFSLLTCALSLSHCHLRNTLRMAISLEIKTVRSRFFSACACRPAGAAARHMLYRSSLSKSL